MRATLWGAFIVIAPLNLLTQSLRFGEAVWQSALIGLAFTPVVLAASIRGTWLGGKIPRARLRQIAVVMLLVIALYALAQPLLH